MYDYTICKEKRMPKVTITLNDDEYNLLKKYSKASKVPMSKCLKKMFFQKLENDELDINVFDRPEQEEPYSVEEVIEDLGLDIK